MMDNQTGNLSLAALSNGSSVDQVPYDIVNKDSSDTLKSTLENLLEVIGLKIKNYVFYFFIFLDWQLMSNEPC
jgi:hypothetical protein